MSLAATVTMVMMLVLLSSLVIVLSGMQAGLSFIESKVEIRAELAEGVAQERVDTLTAQLLALPEVAGVRLHQQGAGARRVPRSSASQTGEPDLTEYSRNPFPAQLSVKLEDPRSRPRSSGVLEAARGSVVAGHRARRGTSTGW